MSAPVPDPAVQRVLDVPLHRELGLRLIDPSSPERGLELEVGDLAVNNVGILHGGLVPLLLDVACYLAVLPELEPGTNAVTASTNASLLAGVKPGATLRATGTVERRGRSLAYLGARLTNADRTVATGQVVKAIVRTD